MPEKLYTETLTVAQLVNKSPFLCTRKIKMSLLRPKDAASYPEPD